MDFVHSKQKRPDKKTMENRYWHRRRHYGRYPGSFRERRQQNLEQA
ncbi:hypothetical protein [Tindallia californiensis]|nr:hypothetical protein [Tindallia californiensis]